MDRSTSFSLVDADVHNYPNALADLMLFLSARRQAYAKQSGLQLPGVSIYPKVFAAAARRDTWPPDGSKPGSDPSFAAKQLFDADAPWRGAIVVNTRDPEGAAAEIRHWSKDRRFVQVLPLVRAHAPYGKRAFWPLLRAAAECDLPVGIHFGGGGDVPITACGWPSYYIEDHTTMTQAFETHVVSLICEAKCRTIHSISCKLLR